MADINIQKKDNKPVWPWVLGVLVVLGLAVWLFSGRSETGAGERLATGGRLNEERAAGTETLAGSDATQGRGMAAPEAEAGAGMGSAALAGPVADYIEYVRESNIRGEMSLDHEFTSNGLSRLGDALNSIVDRHQADININQMRNKFNQKADQIKSNPNSLQHANIISEAFTSAADVISQLQQKHYPNLNSQANEVKQAAQSVKPNEQTLNQKRAVRAFFEKSSNALEAMALNQNNPNESVRR
jgi:hypothetical protein